MLACHPSPLSDPHGTHCHALGSNYDPRLTKSKLVSKRSKKSVVNRMASRALVQHRRQTSCLLAVSYTHLRAHETEADL
eukprot:6378784-Amphidinium_carterae.1